MQAAKCCVKASQSAFSASHTKRASESERGGGGGGGAGGRGGRAKAQWNP